MTSDLDLLRQFARENSQDAFTEIVRRHVNLVYSAAFRQVRSPQLAEEVAQSVFADLARAAKKLNSKTILTAWLYSVARRTAIDVIRKESRRQLRDQIAMEMTNMNATANDWTQIEPLLDDAMAALEETDRSAILLRYFENKSLREVGEALGTSDDAAQKRVSRAVEQLREFFSKRQNHGWRKRTGHFDFRQRRASRAGGTGRHYFRCRSSGRNRCSHFNHNYRN
jgi:RNA polymerase sigma factor (sigma-70 family)